MCVDCVRSHSQVALLNCDLGQAETGPPGLVELTVLSEPLLGPPHTHIRAPLRCVMAAAAAAVVFVAALFCFCGSFGIFMFACGEGVFLLVRTAHIMLAMCLRRANQSYF